MKTILTQIDFVIECRDARIPLTSRNPMFEDLLSGWASGGRERVIVYTKQDLALEEELVGKGTERAVRSSANPNAPSAI